MTTGVGIMEAFVVAGVASAIAIVAACGIEVDMTGKTCPCPSGWFCDEVANQCVTSPPAAVVPPDVDAGDASPTEPPAPACVDTACKCATDQDCKDPKRRYCGPNSACVECVTAPADTCTAGGYCNGQNQCTVGCKAEGDCANGQHCQMQTHQCVECLSATDCPSSGTPKTCSPSGACVETCTGDNTPCGTGGTCCGGFCLSVSKDVLNCGKCGNACSTVNNSPSCIAGKCTFKCADGYDHCGPPGDNTGCETNVRTASNCGGCGVECTAQQVAYATGIACSGDTCTYASCLQGHLDKDKDPTNGCEAPCGDKNQTCCAPPNQCNGGGPCRGTGTCPP